MKKQLIKAVIEMQILLIVIVKRTKNHEIQIITRDP